MLAASVVLLSGAVVVLSPQLVVEDAGAGTAQDARMGTTFADMSAGVLTAKESSEETPPPPRQKITVPQSGTNKTAPPTPAVSKPVEASAAQTPTPHGTPATDPSQTAQPITPVTPAVALAPATPSHAAKAKPTAQLSLSTAPDTMAPRMSSRPKRRDPVLAAKATPKVAKAHPRKHPKSPCGTAKRNNTQGAQTGASKTAKAKTQGTSKREASNSGNAAASNYPGQVMRRISRVLKPRIRSRGVAEIAFTVSSGGSLGWVSVTRSSGSAALNKAALTVIRNAAPFPRPPAGARRTFSIKIKGLS